MQKILVVGASGMLGEPVARRLQADGFTVRVLSRSLEKARSRFGEGFECAAADVDSSAGLDEALASCDAVHINIKAVDDDDMERRATENILRAAHKTGVRRITYLSGASVCEENCWYAGTKDKFEAEAAIRRSGIPYTIFRSHYFMETLHNLVRGNMALQIGRHPKPYYWVAAADYARMVSAAYRIPEVIDKTLYICGPQALTMHQVLEVFTHIAHPEVHIRYIPLWVAGIIARLGKRKELQAVLPFFRYCEEAKVLLSGSQDEANALLGAPSTTIEAWSRAQVGKKSKTR